MTRTAPLSAALALWALSGCTMMGSGVRVEPVAVTTQKPGNVALYVAVSQHDKGVTGLTRNDFKIIENGTRLDNEQIQLTLLPASNSTASHAAVLVDMSKSLKADERKSLSEALRPFIVRLRQHEPVSLYAYDGAEKVHLVQEYPRDARAEPDEKDTSMERLLAFSRRDASTSLFSAVVDGSQKLSQTLAAEGRPVQNGTVIVIALNPDSAGRVEANQLREYVESSPHHYFLMTVGPAASSADLGFIGKNGTSRAGSPMTMTAPLNDVANAVDEDFFRNYVVSYCSPSRAGVRELRLEVTTRDAQGTPSVGSYATQFDATGFGPGCNAEAPPRFLVVKPKEPIAIASTAKPSGKPRRPSSEPRPKAEGSSPAVPKASAAPVASSPERIAEPPSGLGYE